MRKNIWVIFISLTLMVLACGRKEPSNQNSSTTVNSNISGTTGGVISDAMVTALAKLALIADNRTSGFDIDVSAVNGVITLTGKTESDEAKAAASEVAGNVNGARSVNNQLQVVPEAKREPVNATDEKIGQEIEKLVESDEKLGGLFITTNAGVVSVRGEVDSYDQLVSAAQALRKVPGVKRVDTTGVRLKEQ